MHPDLSKLTNKEREAYQFLNTHQQLISYMSLRDIAKQTHISTATILRLITKMGYKSFQEYKFSLKEDESVDLSYDLTEIIKALKHLEDDYYEEKLYEIAGMERESWLKQDFFPFHQVIPSSSTLQCLNKEQISFYQ